MIVLRAWDKEYAIAQSRPSIWLRPAVIRKHHYLDARGLRTLEHFDARALGVLRILGMHVQHGAIIVVNAGRRSRLAILRELRPRLMNSLEMRPLETLQCRVLAAGTRCVVE